MDTRWNHRSCGKWTSTSQQVLARAASQSDGITAHRWPAPGSDQGRRGPACARSLSGFRPPAPYKRRTPFGAERRLFFRFSGGVLTLAQGVRQRGMHQQTSLEFLKSERMALL